MEFEDETTWIRKGTDGAAVGLVFALPLLFGGLSLAVGLVVGGAAGWYAGQGDPAPVVASADIDPNDIRFGEVCAPLVAEAQTQIESLNTEISLLEDDIAQRAAGVAALEIEMKRRAEGGKQLAAQLRQAREELAIVQQERDQLVAVKDQLVIELTRTAEKLVQTEQQLEEQVQLTEIARDSSVSNNWQRFLNEAQLEICEKGNRKKLGDCRETVTALIGTAAVEARFEHCVRSGQATPTVAAIGKDEALPEYGYWLDQDEKIVRDWYVLLCDPTLPETDALFASALTL